MMSAAHRPYSPSTGWRRLIRVGGSLVLIVVACLVAGVLGALCPFSMSLGQIQPWSFSLGQVAFGLTAAFVAFILPQISEFRQWWEIWRGRVSDRRPTLANEMVNDLRVLLEHQDLEGRVSGPSRRDLALRLGKWSEYGETANLSQFQKTGLILRQVLENDAAWLQILERAGLTHAPHIGSDPRFRWMLIAEANAAEFQTLYERLGTSTLTLCILTFVLGAFSLSPDPFFFGTADYFWGDRLSPDFDHQQYPMLGLVFPAMVALLAMALLGYLIGNAYGRLKILDPRRHDGGNWMT